MPEDISSCPVDIPPLQARHCRGRESGTLCLGSGNTGEPLRRSVAIVRAGVEGCTCSCNEYQLTLILHKSPCVDKSPVDDVHIVSGVGQGGNCSLDWVHPRLVEEAKPCRSQQVERVPEFNIGVIKL